jgi:lipopolysaccharide transport system permease protein
MIETFARTWRYRFFIFSSIKTEFHTQFIRSRLGGLWMLLQPLSQVLIFAFVLSEIMSARLPGTRDHYAYSIYLMSGILAWSLFTEILNRSVSLFIENGNLLKKISFPKMALPLIVLGRALVNNILLLLAMLVIFALLNHYPGLNILYLPFLIILTSAFALGLGLTLGVLNVFIRDIGQLVPIIVQIWFWFTPIVYVANIIPEQYQHYLAFNPMVSIAQAYQSVLLYNQEPHWTSLINIFALSVILLVIALVIFRKASPEMVDQL